MYILKRLPIIFILVMAIAGCTDAGAPAVVVSISKGGQYVISSHRDNSLVLWDLGKRESKLLATNANIYSAYFVKNGKTFLWQNLNNEVVLQNISGEVLRKFKQDPVYGHVLSKDHKHYFASDIGWSIRYRKDFGPEEILKKRDGKAFIGFGKLLNFTLSTEQNNLLISGYSYSSDKKYSLENEKNNKHYAEMNGVSVWNISTLKPVAKLTGNAAKTHATFSPNGKTILTGCENGIGIIWDAKEHKRIDWLDNIFHGRIIDRALPVEQWKRDKSKTIKLPASFYNGAIISLKYISEDSYLRFTNSQPYAILYKNQNNYPSKIIKLGKSPFPSVSDYSRNTAIDTAPEAGILVTGQRDGNGINVYKFDKDKLELEKVWVTH